LITPAGGCEVGRANEVTRRMTTTGPGVGWPERSGSAAGSWTGGSAAGIGWPGAARTGFLHTGEGGADTGGRDLGAAAGRIGQSSLSAVDGGSAVAGRSGRGRLALAVDDPRRADPLLGASAPFRRRRGADRDAPLSAPALAAQVEGAIVMPGSGEARSGLRSGLGWPRLVADDVGSQPRRRGDLIRDGSARSGGAALVLAAAPSPGSNREGGIGWPRQSIVATGEPHVPGAGAATAAGSETSVRLVSRETPDFSTESKSVQRTESPGLVHAGLVHRDLDPSEQVRAPARAPGPASTGGAREASEWAGWPEGTAANAPVRESSYIADNRPPAVPDTAEERHVWGSDDQGSIPAGRMSHHPSRPMIAGTYPGAASASGESEDEVPIPAPDTSADTPIERAAQAAMKARAGGQAWPRPESCRIMTIANQKGGVGKTTTAVNLAASLAMNGARVLVVDLDPQGNASTALDVEHRSGTPSVYNVLVDGMPLAEVVRPVEGFRQLFCAPATIDLAGSEIELVPLVAREARLARALGEYDASELDYMFIDCPPSLGLLTVNALVAAPEVLIPIQCEYYALEGLEQSLRTVDLVRSHLNQKLKISTILLTMYDSRTRLASQVADEVRGHFGDLVLSSVIPRSVRVSEAPSYGQSVMTYDPGSSGALAYLEAAREMAFRNTQAVTA
jgi:chromosome partitioning protein